LNGTTADFWATPRQLGQLESLVEHLGPEQAAPVLRQFCGGELRDAARFLTRREAASLVILLTVVASQQPLVA
jgi:hypothetical protein